MGVFANGPSPRVDVVDVPGIAAAMRPALELWFSGHIQILDLRRSTTPSPKYDPIADNGGTVAPVIILDSGAAGALIQPLRIPNPAVVGGQPSSLQGVRFQIKRSVSVTDGQVLRGGLVVKVIDGGNEPELQRYLYALDETVNSSLAWDRIYEAHMVTTAVQG